MALSERDINKRLKRHLKRINDVNVMMNRIEAQRNVDIMERTVQALLSEMKAVDPLFNDLYQRLVYTGSYYHGYYEGLRVKSANEFDINLVLRLPFKSRDVEIMDIPVHAKPAYMQFHLLRSVDEIYPTRELYRQLAKFFNENGKLLRTKVQYWMQSVTDRAFTRFECPPEVKKVTISQHGPAFTYYLRLFNGQEIDLDLVPAIDCTPYDLPQNIYISDRFAQLMPSEQSWFLIPKPVSFGDDANTFWRISFPEAEKQLIKSQGCVKMLIKLLKLLRDCRRWASIYSYCIKTLFLLEMDEYPDREDWLEDDLGTLYIRMLRLLKSALDVGRIPYYFDRNANLLEGLHYDTRVNISAQIQKLISRIYLNPDCIKEYYEIIDYGPQSYNTILAGDLLALGLATDQVIVYPGTPNYEIPESYYSIPADDLSATDQVIVHPVTPNYEIPEQRDEGSCVIL